MGKLESEEKKNMKAFERCPVCGGELIEKEVEKLLKGGMDTAVVRAFADVCLHCGERYYSESTIRKFEVVRNKLSTKDTNDFEKVGLTYQVV